MFYYISLLVKFKLVVGSLEERFLSFVVLNRITRIVFFSLPRKYYRLLFSEWERLFNLFSRYYITVTERVCSLKRKTSHWKVFEGETFFFLTRKSCFLTNCWFINSWSNDKALIPPNSLCDDESAGLMIVI